MPDWADLSRENIAAAKLLINHGLYRSSTSRAYFAVYAALTARLVKVKTVQFAYGGNNPSHEQLPGMIEQLPSRLAGKRSKQELRRILRLLRQARLEADYSPNSVLRREDAAVAVREASRLMASLEIEL